MSRKKCRQQPETSLAEALKNLLPNAAKVRP